MTQGDRRNPAQTSEEAKRGYNTYYLRVASRFGLAKWVTLLLFSIYLLCMLFINRENITYENFLYLFRDLNVKTVTGTYHMVQYPEQQNMTFSSFKDELVVAGTTGVSLYDRNGEAVYTEEIAYKTPQIVSGDKYMLVYDASGTGYSVFTSLACVKRGQMEDSIQCAALSDDGSYAVASQCSEAKYVVCVYNSSFVEIARYYRDSYIIGMAFSSDGRELAILSVSPSGWNFSGNVTLCSIGSEKTTTLSLGTSMPLRGRYMNSGRLAIVCDNAVYSVDTESGSVSLSYAVSSMTLECFDLSSNKVVLCCGTNVLGTSNHIVVLDENGAVMMDEIRSEKVSRVVASGGQNSAYIVYAGMLEICHVLASQKAVYYGTILDVCEIGGYPLLCFSDGAYAVAES